MQSTSQISRQGRGCGYEPPAPKGVVVRPWLPPDSRVGYDFGKDSEEYPIGMFAPLVCVGYTRTMPEVIVVERARLHWSKGQLSVYCGSAEPTETLRDLIEISESQHNSVQNYEMTPQSKGGGRPD